MATPINLEAAASQRINPFLKGLTMLTGGLAGEFTGTNEQIRERNKARQALLQEELNKRDEDRAIKRQLMANALQQRITLDPNSSIEQMMEKIRSEGVKGEVMASEGYTRGLGQSMGPSQYEADPRFQAAAQAGQLELAKRKAIAGVEEDLQRPKIVSQLAGFGVQADPNLPTGQLTSMLRLAETRAQSQIPLETQGKRARAQLSVFQGTGDFPTPVNIANLSDEEAIAQAEIASRKQQGRDFYGAAERGAKRESDALKTFNQLLSTPDVNKADLQAAYYNLGKDEQKNEEYRIAAGVQRPATSKENEALDKYRNSVERASALVGSIQDFVGTGDIAKASKDNFNGFKSWMRGLENKYGAEDPRLQSINNVVQEFQRLIAEQRKDFFGASLTDNEFAVARQLFADPNQANFLPRVLSLVDSIMAKDEINRKYTRRGIFVDSETRKEIDDVRNQWFDTKSKLNFGQSANQPAGTKKNEQIQQLRNEFNALRSALTNAPSATR